MKHIDLEIEVKGSELQRKIHQLIPNYTNCKANVFAMAIHHNNTDSYYRLYLQSPTQNEAFINNIKSFIYGIIALYKSY